MILIIDNYDSFTFNLVQQFKAVPTKVLRNDDPQLFQVAQQAAGIVLSPGPGRPEDAGKMLAIIEEFKEEKPILGICLGHQGIGEVFGANVVAASEIMHGKQSIANYRKKGLLTSFNGELVVMRYHSLMLQRESLPKTLEILAQTPDCIMAVQHETLPIYGLQFHPESLGTPQGQYFIDEFIKVVEGKTDASIM